MIENGIYVVVATDKRGVFAGVLESYDRDKRTVLLSDARQCVYWSKETRGFNGLAAHGPKQGSRVSPPAPLQELPEVHCVAACSPEARTEWESDKWS